MVEEKTKKVVKENYGRIAGGGGSFYSSPKSSCVNACRKIGYTEEEIGAAPGGSNLGLGCGNPVAIASLKKGETVLDLGSGAGLDCFIAAGKVGRSGKVIGVDMTPEMVERARAIAGEGGYKNVEFKLAEIENLPVEDGSVDVVISNCVINLSVDKGRVFGEAFRVLKPGGRMILSDIVLTEELPYLIKKSVELYKGCVSGAVTRAEYIKEIDAAGFRDVSMVDEMYFSVENMISNPFIRAAVRNLKKVSKKVEEAAGAVVSVKVRAAKPISARLQQMR